MTSKQIAEFVGGYADAGEDAAQRALRDVAACVDWDGNRPAIGVAHEMVATFDPRDDETNTFESPDDPRSRYGRDAARHKA